MRMDWREVSSLLFVPSFDRDLSFRFCLFLFSVLEIGIKVYSRWRFLDLESSGGQRSWFGSFKVGAFLWHPAGFVCSAASSWGLLRRRFGKRSASWAAKRGKVCILDGFFTPLGSSGFMSMKSRNLKSASREVFLGARRIWRLLCAISEGSSSLWFWSIGRILNHRLGENGVLCFEIVVTKKVQEIFLTPFVDSPIRFLSWGCGEALPVC